MDRLPDFTTFAFTHAGRQRTIYRNGEGPAVLIMHEVPGMSAEVVRFARRVVDAGFTVFMPHLFGPVGVKTTPFNRVPELLRICISREFHVLAENRSSPIAEWLRACVTGNFALTLTLDPWIVAPVMGHPSLPLPI